MDRARRVASLWNWLPAFRVVAEYESIQKAALVLHVSPSSLSRTIKLIEDVVGTSLFVRSPSGLTLTSFGVELLKGTREAMRRVDDALEGGGANQLRGATLVAGAHGSTLGRLLGVATADIAGRAAIRFRLLALAEELVVDELLRGNVDVALVDAATSLDLPQELIREPLGELAFALHAPPGHPLARDAAAAAVETARTVVLEGSDATGDRVAATVPTLDAAERVAASGPFLALLPRGLVAPTFVVVGPDAARVAVIALVRRTLDGGSPAPIADLLTALRAHLAPR